MAELAPDALKWLGARTSLDLGGVLSGIVGDSAHKSGYHRGRNYVPVTDYSRRLLEDKSGSGEVACAIDMSFDPARMKLYTGRLKAAADRNDPRLKYVREFYGTLNGTTVYGRTHSGSLDGTWESATSDTSHLWHVHMSILRQYSNIQNVMQGILDVLKGKPLVEEDMLADERAWLKALFDNIVPGFAWNGKVKTVPQLVKDVAWAQEFGPGASGGWLVNAVGDMQAELVARDEADKVRDAANAAVIKSVVDALNKVLTEGGSVDSAALVNAVNTAATETRTQVAALQAEVAELKRRLSAAAQAEATALNS